MKKRQPEPEEEVPKEENPKTAEPDSASSSGCERSFQEMAASVLAQALHEVIAGKSTEIPRPRSYVQQKADAAALLAAAAPVFATPVPTLPPPPRAQVPAESKRLHLQRLKDIAYAEAEGYSVFQPIVTKTKAAEKEDSVALDREALQDPMNAQGLSAVLVQKAVAVYARVTHDAQAAPPTLPEEEEAELLTPPTPSENGDFLDHAHDPPQAELTQKASKKKKVDHGYSYLVHKEKFIRLAVQDLAMTAEDALSKWEAYEKAPGFPADRDQKGPPGSRLRLRLLSMGATSASASDSSPQGGRSWLMHES
jgi:hypothetical protein